MAEVITLDGVMEATEVQAHCGIEYHRSSARDGGLGCKVWVDSLAGEDDVKRVLDKGATLLLAALRQLQDASSLQIKEQK